MTILAPEHGDLHQSIARTRGVVLVMFTAVGCGSCRRMRTALAQCPELPVLEVDAGIDQALASEFEVFHLPALFAYCDGRYHGPLEVESVPARIRARLAELLAQPAQDPP